jgi:PAS domain S-box-containing protein
MFSRKKKQPRGGIERKFLASIFWVGVIPMSMAVIIGYLFAREGQWVATQQNQLTAVQKTVEGVWLAVEGRLRMAGRVAMDKDIISALRKRGEDPSYLLHYLIPRLHKEYRMTGDVPSFFRIYDREGRLLLTTQNQGDTSTLPEKDRRHPEWVESITQPAITTFTFEEDAGHYAIHIVSPVKDPDTGGLLGFVVEIQDAQDLLEFALGHGRNLPGTRSDRNYYEVVYLSDDSEFRVYLEEEESGSGGGTRLQYDIVDVGLSKRLLEDPGKASDSFFLWQYSTGDISRPVLLAWYRYPGWPLYFIVHRPVAAVFARINLGAMLAVVITMIVIGIFCLIGYRLINNDIIRPLSLLNEGAQIIRQGDLELKLKIGTGDEIEELASSFNQMATALRHNIKQLEASEEKYRSLINSMRDGIYQTDIEGVISFINPAGAEIFGYNSTEKVQNRHLREFFVEAGDYARIVQRLNQQQFIEHTRLWMQKTGNQTICVELSANSIFDEKGRFAGAEGLFRDVTQNVRLGREARERAERISAINQIANAINSSLEAGRVYESIVAEVKKLADFDYAALTLLSEDGQRIESRQLWPETEIAASRDPLPLSAENAEGSCAAWVAREGRCLLIQDLHDPECGFCGHFSPHMRSCLCVPLHAGGRIIGTLNLASRQENTFNRHDIEVLEELTAHIAVAIRNARLLEDLQKSLREVTLAREKLHEANEELKTLDEMKTNLLSNVSHELRTPLVAVMGYTDMIANGKAGPVNEVQQEYLNISLRNIEKLVTLIENLLDFSRLHRGQEELLFDTFDIADCARTSTQIVEPVAKSRDISINMDVPEDPVLVEGDKGKLGQVFNNLLSNAVKFNQSGGEVNMAIRPGDFNVEVVVSDTGIGVPQEAQDKIFTRFYQYDASSTRKYGGTGIGLSIAQDIMRLHGSRIMVTSREGEGASFSFILPLSGVQRTEAEAKDGTVRPRPLPTETHLLIELVTQDRALSAQIRNILIAEGMDVIHASYPAVAISLANKYNPDCILLDSEAGPLGSVVVDEIISDPSAGEIPIILLTNDDELYASYQMRSEERRAQGFGGGLAGRVKRSFRKSSLLSGIHYALSKGVTAGRQLGDKILCVDDDPEIVDFIQLCLEAEGYESTGCATGEEALVFARTGEYWMVLLDIAMPGLDGWETCRLLKSDANLAGIKVYMVTAKPIDKSVPMLEKCGADGYLSKPFKAEDLLGLVQVFDARRNRRGENA